MCRRRPNGVEDDLLVVPVAQAISDFATVYMRQIAIRESLTHRAEAPPYRIMVATVGQ